MDWSTPMPYNFDAAKNAALGQHPADDAENFLTIVAFRAAVVCDKPIARHRLALEIVDRRMIHDQLAWRASQRGKRTLNHPIFEDAVARSKR